jgi:hypothetical protein
MRFEIGVEREENKNKMSWKAYFSSCYFFIIPCHLHFQDDF